MIENLLKKLNKEKTILIAGPTASGKSELAVLIAKKLGGVIVNADSMQVYKCWNILSARPSVKQLSSAPHLLFGHIHHKDDYSVGHWLREIDNLLSSESRMIIVGGTGLYFYSLINGLADIPKISQETRLLGNKLNLNEMIQSIDYETLKGIDPKNKARVQRAWEVEVQTGQSLKEWQKHTPPPLINFNQTDAIVLQTPSELLEKRIIHRFDQMLQKGVLEEVKKMQESWDPKKNYTKAIGGKEIISYLRNEIDLETTRRLSIIATRQYAKRQRTWFQKNMSNWIFHEL